jgi:DNA-binding NarL/FixJ family response regulator
VSPEKARVFMVDDHALIRAGIKAELAGSVEFIGEADEVAAAIEMIIDRSPDVVLLDVHMPDGGGLAVLEGVVERDASVKFLALSVSDAAEDVIAIIRAGARGYVTKSIEGPELIEAIERTAAGDAVFSRRLAGFVLDAFTKGADQLHTTPSMLDPELDQLTPREIEVLRLIARGYSYREIATQLDISIKTVESHVSAVLRKLQLSNRHQLTNWATERRLL